MMRLAAALSLLALAPAPSVAKEHECLLHKHEVFSDRFEVAPEPRTIVVVRTVVRGEYSGRKLSACRIELNCDVPPGTKKFGYRVPGSASGAPAMGMLLRPGDLVHVDEKACSITRVVPGNPGTLYIAPLSPELRRQLLGAPNTAR